MRAYSHRLFNRPFPFYQLIVEGFAEYREQFHGLRRSSQHRHCFQ